MIQENFKGKYLINRNHKTKGEMKMKKVKITVVLLTIAMLAGCATLKVGEKSVKPDRTSGSKPEWVPTDIEYKETKDKIYIRVEAQGSDRNYLKRVSLDAAANEMIVQKAHTIAKRELAEALKGTRSTSVGQAGENVINVLSKAKYSSLTREASYWERYPIKSVSGNIEYEYEMWGWYSITMEDYKDAKRRAWNEGVKKISISDKEARDLLEKSKERFILGF